MVQTKICIECQVKIDYDLMQHQYLLSGVLNGAGWVEECNGCGMKGIS